MSESLALGTELLIGDGASPEVFTEVALLREFTPPGLTVDVEETTNHSQANYFRQFRPTLINPGELSGQLLFDPADATHDDSTGVLSLLLDRARHNMKIRIPTDPILNYDFAAIVTQFQPGTPTDQHLTADFTAMVSGAVVIATQPIVASVEDTGAQGPAYVEGESIQFTGTFDKAVTVTGSPRITINLAGTGGNVLLTYASGSGTAALVFSLTAGAAGVHQAELTEVTMVAQTIDLNGGTIRDANGNPARLTIATADIGDLTGVSVNAS
jgi:hypothetical protein